MVRENLGWTTQHPYLALLKAKRAFRFMYTDKRTGRPMPRVSNKTLAQYLSKALVAWKTNRESLKQE
ncbi:hypothetical protein BO94DRAFT_608352 [Aspergillus sclerotioniger CBS 115572]|uniref:Uncharacterized protein n=1 Tax=Aspergillus sclerotioniger CBS 115572 TaxID=1450535 RepID=A0A317VFA0_9EURO|nr:hypothetical protein BO94DRAFT_608352 [Aspergillus sclerotioniger CBS 115572]PWY71767.1 hypothetical protein BO94DRAFT_608352 [Aspergillus sclerotioniger CBS 115572]